MIAYDAMRRETAAVGDEAETMTAAEMLRAMDLYRQLSGKPLMEVAMPAPPQAEPDAQTETPEASPGVAEIEKPAAGDATVTPLDVTRKRP
jgi:hypothetical protein